MREREVRLQAQFGKKGGGKKGKLPLPLNLRLRYRAWLERRSGIFPHYYASTQVNPVLCLQNQEKKVFGGGGDYKGGNVKKTGFDFKKKEIRRIDRSPLWSERGFPPLPPSISRKNISRKFQTSNHQEGGKRGSGKRAALPLREQKGGREEEASIERREFLRWKGKMETSLASLSLTRIFTTPRTMVIRKRDKSRIFVFTSHCMQSWPRFPP